MQRIRTNPRKLGLVTSILDAGSFASDTTQWIRLGPCHGATRLSSLPCRIVEGGGAAHDNYYPEVFRIYNFVSTPNVNAAVTVGRFVAISRP